MGVYLRFDRELSAVIDEQFPGGVVTDETRRWSTSVRAGRAD